MRRISALCFLLIGGFLLALVTAHPSRADGCYFDEDLGAYVDCASAGPTSNPQSSASSVQSVANAQTSQMITDRILASVLLGVNEQVNCSDCVSAFGSVGSFQAGAHGRKKLTDNLALMGGVSYSQFNENGYKVSSAPIVALDLRYDFVELGSSRPFFDVGTVLSPSQRVSYDRDYSSSIGASSITSPTHSSDYSAFGRVGWVTRLSPIDEVAAAVELWRGWQHVDAFSEAATPSNPFDAAFAAGTDQSNLVKVGGQWTHLFGNRVEFNINGGVVQSFDSRSGVSATITGVGFVAATASNQMWGELGSRIGYRITKDMTTDVFVNGTVGPKPVGNTVHGGVGLRLNF